MVDSEEELKTICIPGCKRQDVKNMIRCSFCMLKAHTTSVGEINAYSGPWSCFDCRQTSKLIAKLQASVELAIKLTYEAKTRTISLKQLVQKLSKEVKSMSDTNTKLLTLNTLLTEQLNDIEAKVPNKKASVPRTSAPDLLIGSSLLRYIKTKEVKD